MKCGPLPRRRGALVFNLIQGVIERPSKPNHQPFFSSILFFFLFLLVNKPAREACIFIFSFIIVYFYLPGGQGPREGSGTSMYVCMGTHTYISDEIRQGRTREVCDATGMCREGI